MRKKRKHTLFCLTCSEQLPDDSSGNRKYCDKCKRTRYLDKLARARNARASKWTVDNPKPKPSDCWPSLVFGKNDTLKPEEREKTVYSRIVNRLGRKLADVEAFEGSPSYDDYD